MAGRDQILPAQPVSWLVAAQGRALPEVSKCNRPLFRNLPAPSYSYLIRDTGPLGQVFRPKPKSYDGKDESYRKVLAARGPYRQDFDARQDTN